MTLQEVGDWLVAHPGAKISIQEEDRMLKVAMRMPNSAGRFAEYHTIYSPHNHFPQRSLANVIRTMTGWLADAEESRKTGGGAYVPGV